MKKLLAGLAATVLMGTGVAALNVETSVAAVAPGYPGSINTVCHAYGVGKPHVGDDVKAYFSVSQAGNGTPHGRVMFTYDKRNSSVSYDFDKYFPGGEKVYEFGPMKRGKYDVHVHFDSRPENSVYQNCNTDFVQRVRR